MNKNANLYIYVDELQKLYFPCENIAIAIAGNNLLELQSILKSIFDNVGELKSNIINSKTKYNYNNHIKRLIERNLKQLKSTSEIIIGITFPNAAKYNKLYYYKISNHEIKYSKEIVNKEYCVGGSIKDECEFYKFKSDVLESSFSNKISIDIAEQNSLFHSLNIQFNANSNYKWSSVGELVHTIYTRDGILYYSDVSSTYHNDNNQIKVSLEFDELRKCYIQKNHINDEKIDLISFDKYKFNLRYSEISEKIFKLEV
nr:hypothetical protein [Clostridioides sp.]